MHTGVLELPLVSWPDTSHLACSGPCHLFCPTPRPLRPCTHKPIFHSHVTRQAPQPICSRTHLTLWGLSPNPSSRIASAVIECCRNANSGDYYCGATTTTTANLVGGSFVTKLIPNAHQHRLHHLTKGPIGFCMYGSSACLGACAKPPPPTPSDRPGGQRRPRSAASNKRRVRVRGHTAKPPRDWWTTSSNELENHSTLSPRSFQNFPSLPPLPASGTANTMSANNTNAYSNQALALWNEQRCAWVGTQPRPPPPREPREPAISWNTTYEDLLATSRPFVQPIPLSEMVDFLVDVWEQEGLY